MRPDFVVWMIQVTTPNCWSMSLKGVLHHLLLGVVTNLVQASLTEMLVPAYIAKHLRGNQRALMMLYGF